MSRAWTVCAILAVFGLSEGAAQEPRVVVRFRSHPLPIVLDTIARYQEVGAPSGVVLATVRAVLDQIGLRVALDDSARGVIGNLRWARSATVAGERPSRSLNCGAGLTGPNADSFRLTLAFAAFVDPRGPQRSRLGFALVAEGQNVTGTGGQPVACESTGTLETRLFAAVLEALPQAHP